MADTGAHMQQVLGKTEAEMLDIMSYFMLFLAAFTFVGLITLKAPYGRYSGTMWCGFDVNGTFAWFVQELPAFLVPLLLAGFTSVSDSNMVGRVLTGYFLVHYAQRTFIYPFVNRGGKDIPVAIFVGCTLFCAWNGYLQGSYLLHLSPYQDSWFMDPRFIIGSVLFFFGLLVNVHSDRVLKNLRKPGETGYKIPEGGLFRYISGANFFGEIVEWTGFAIACWSFPALAFCIFTICNIGHRAFHHHQWYLQKFEDYPKCRKALIPFLL